MPSRSFSLRLRSRHASRVAPLLGVFALLGACLVSRSARADRYYVVYADPQPRSSFDLGFDVEGVIPTSTPQFLSGNNLSGGGGFKVRFGDQIRLPGVRITPEGGYAFDHLFASDDLGNSYDWDMHRFFGGIRVAFGRTVSPGFYAHLGYGWRGTGDPTVLHPDAGGLAFDTGFALDFHVIHGFGFGAHVEYATIDAQPYTPQWVSLGLHCDILFF